MDPCVDGFDEVDDEVNRQSKSSRGEVIILALGGLQRGRRLVEQSRPLTDVSVLQYSKLPLCSSWSPYLK